ncbi:sel1 repeat family protein [Pseudoxanthomonas gei]|uniref:Sel1 repeat family protein n=1 Tax=Pseudoxanthomonas gei TaxID=1383030 RepID=A0ABX0AGI8_9GAMM|nr:sel1 repeat family protein [Pseudoxanthomonas gei]NDK38318.1 sel1 repeat family protein [Pseudoxanthomonas gei]
MRRRLAARLCLGLVVSFPLHAMAAVVDIDSVATDAGKAWQEFMQSAEFERAYSAYEVLDKVEYSAEGVDAEACRLHAAEVDDALVKAPVSIVVVRTALLCAEATGQAERATRLEGALVSLSREALKDGRQLPWPMPIRVLGPSDVYALLQVAGLEARYEYFVQTRPARYFPLAVAAWDAEAGKETTYLFDYVDVTSRLKGSNEYAGYPFYKDLLADFFEAAQVKGNELAAVDLKAVRTAMQLAEPAAKVKALRVSSGYGGIQSLRLWITLCARRPFSGCGEGLEDILLEQAEAKHVVPMVMLAFLHGEGLVARRDDEVADGLLAAALRRASAEEVALEYMSLATLADRPKAIGRKSLADAMERPAVRAALAAWKLQRDEHDLQESDLQVLAAPASNAIGVGHWWLSQYWREKDRKDLRLESLRLAAEAGDPGALQMQAFNLMTDSPEAAPGLVLDRMRSAALGGEVPAMKYLSDRAAMLHEWKAAERWLMASVRAGDSEAMLDLAALYAKDHAALGQSARQAMDWYVELGEAPAMGEARRRAAYMAMKGTGIAKDPLRAERWLLRDAETGDGTSQLLLAIGYLEGDLGPDGAVKAQPWIDRILAAKELGPKVGYADWLYRNRTGVEDRALAVRLWTEAQDDDESWALNNMAWAYCTAVDPAARNVAAGMKYSEKMLKQPDLAWGRLDTVAACQAASGDHAGAARSQQAVITRFTRYWSLDSLAEEHDQNGYLRRLRLYQQNKPYLDDSPATAD